MVTVQEKLILGSSNPKQDTPLSFINDVSCCDFSPHLEIEKNNFLRKIFGIFGSGGVQGYPCTGVLSMVIKWIRREVGRVGPKVYIKLFAPIS